MDLPAPLIRAAHCVLAPARPFGIDGEADERFIAAVSKEFPNVVNRQVLPSGVPPQTPFMMLASTSSQLAVSAAQIDFEVRFYGEYEQRLDLCHAYIGRKLRVMYEGLVARGETPAFVGVVLTLNYSFADIESDPREHMLATHLRMELEPGSVQDLGTRVAVKLRDTYFAVLAIANYELKQVMRPVLPGRQQIIVKPWEGEVQDTGIELTVDVNNRLEAFTKQGDPVVTEAGVGAVLDIVDRIATEGAGRYVETAHVDLEALVQASQ